MNITNFNAEVSKQKKEFDRGFRNAVIGVIVCVILFVGGLHILLSKGKEQLDKNKHEIEQLVGQRVTIGKDTLQIIDYTTLNETYTLADNRTVSFDFAKKHLVK